MTQSKIVVFYTGNETENNNRIFDKSVAGFNRYVWGWNYLYEACKERGITMMTSDVYLQMPERPPAILMYHSIQMSPLKDLLQNKSLRPAILTFHEGPLYGCFVYWNLKKFSSHFDHVFLPRGAAERISPKTVFHPHVDPLPYSRDEVIIGGFDERKFLVLINRNARMNPWKVAFARFAQIMRPFSTFDPREIYYDRLNAIKYFSRHPKGFDLYGHFWDRPIQFVSERTQKIFRGPIQASYRGEVDDKMKLLQNYKFSICFENTIFGGYVTEKIFDSMFAGCIPVYFGAPDIADFVPENTFIDFRKFAGYAELDRYLSGMDKATYDGYIKNINEFLRSERYRSMSQERFADTMVPVIESYFR
jgi:hypothetical protein